jgi:5-hydroxyisourate hydrolase
MITTHVLDLASGKPAAGVRVALSIIRNGERTAVASGVTDADGRLKDLMPLKTTLEPATYELTFETGPYFVARGIQPFHPRIAVSFDVTDAGQHYHVPLLVSPFGFTTYRGS